MKKMLAALLAAIMLMSVCSVFAEGTVTVVPYDENLSFSFVYPEGYTGTVVTDDSGALVNTILSDESAAPNFLMVIVPEDQLDASTTLKDLTDDQKSELVATLVEDWANPTETVMETGHGTQVMLIEENDAEYDMAKLVALYNGYVISMLIGHDDGSTVTEDDVAAGLQIFTDMEFISAVQ